MAHSRAKVVVTCGLSNSKLQVKLAGLVSSPSVDRIILVRKAPLFAEKTENRNPPRWVARSIACFEIWRFLTVLSLGLRGEARTFVGIQAQMHGVIAVLVAKITGAKSILWLIGSDLSIYSQKGPLAPFVRAAIRRADTVFVMGDGSRHKVREVCGRRHKVIIQRNVFERGHADLANNAAKKWDLIFVGNFVDVKNPLAAVSLFSRIRKERPSARFCMLGDGELRQSVLRKIESCDLAAYVDLPGQVSDPLNYIVQSKILVITSKNEGLPAVLLEASNLGVPVVSSAVGEIAQLSEEYEGIRGVPAANMDAFVVECLRLLCDEGAYGKSVASISRFADDQYKMWSLEGHQRTWEKALEAI